MVELSGAQARITQNEHWSQQQCSLAIGSYLQLTASRFVQGLPGEARLHSDKRYNITKTDVKSYGANNETEKQAKNRPRRRYQVIQ